LYSRLRNKPLNNLCIFFKGLHPYLRGFVYLVFEFRINLEKESQSIKNQLVSWAEFYGGRFIQGAIFILFNKFSRDFYVIPGGMSIPESRVSMYSHITAGKIHKTNNNLYKLLTLIIWLIQPMKEEILT